MIAFRLPALRFVRVTFVLTVIGLLATPLAMPSAQVKAPAVAGVTLGMTPRDVGAMLGSPDRQQTSLGMRFWEYPGRGITVIWREDAPGVNAIVVSKRGAGVVREVRVGDATQQVFASWGTPVRVRNSGRFIDFVGRGWTLSAEIANGRAVEITLLAAR